MAKKKQRKKTNQEPVEVMVVNDSGSDECRIAILVDDHLDELFSESASNATNVGNIYKGRVVNVEPAIQAAFVDFGEGQNGFLHISDLHPRYFPGDENTERVGRKMPHRERPPIQEALKRGQEVLVQVLKEGIGTKGPTLTSYLSIPGRMLVLMPHMDRVGVSRKVEDDDQRREMRKILDSLDLPEGFGFILRTAGVGQSKREISRDVAYLNRLWKAIEDREKHVNGPCELYTESDVLIRTVRDVLRPGIKAIICDSDAAYDKISTFMRVVSPRSTTEVIRYRRPAPIFHAFNIERQIDLIHSREVPLESGGALVIDQTEALVAIDVNSGRSRSARDSETNAYQTNCEAIDEICRQLRLRDMGGLVILDLIDMRSLGKRRDIETRMRENLKRDRAKTTALRISDFGLMQLTRQRMRPSLRKAHFVSCPMCQGHGEIRSPESVATGAVRQIEYLIQFENVHRLEIVCSPRVASVLLSSRRRELVYIEERHGKSIDVRVSEAIPTDRVDFYAYDIRNADIDPMQLPKLTSPSMKALTDEASSWVDDGDAEGDSGTGRRKSRRRRRRKPAPADATAIALAGGFDIEDDEDDAELEDAAPTKRKRRRRRGRKSDAGEEGGGEQRGRDADADATDESVESKDSRRSARTRRRSKPAAPVIVYPSILDEDKPVRIFALAKALEMKSKDIIDRCASEESLSIDIKNHMSSVSVEEAKAICDLYLTPEVVEEEPPVESTEDGPAEEEGEGKRRRRRRGRRGGRKRRRSSNEDGDGSNDVEGGADEASETDAASSAASPAASTEDGDAPTGTKKRRRRRSKKKAGNGEASVESGPAAEDTSASEPTSGDSSSSEPKKKKKRTTKKKSSAGGRGKASSGDSGSKNADSGGGATVEVKIDDETAGLKPRRSLYRTRRKVSAAARTIAKKADDQ